MQDGLKEGEQINGMMVIMIKSDPNFYKQIAERALKQLDTP